MAVNNGAFYSQTQGLKLSTNSTNRVIVSTAGTTTFTGITSGSTLIDVRGTSGQLMSVTDTLTGSLLTVNNNIGNSIFQVNSNSSIIGGSANTNTFVISGTNVGIGTRTPESKLQVSGLTTITGQWNTSSTVNGLHFSFGHPVTGPNIGQIYSIQNGSTWRRLDVEGDPLVLNAQSGGNVGIGTVSPSNKLHVFAATDPIKVEGVQTGTDTELLTIDGSGVIHKVSSSSVGGAFLRNETNSGATDTITINQSIFNPSDLTVLSTSVFIVDTNADYYILGDLYNYGDIVVDGTLKVGGVIYNRGTITGSGIIE